MIMDPLDEWRRIDDLFVDMRARGNTDSGIQSFWVVGYDEIELNSTAVMLEPSSRPSASSVRHTTLLLLLLMRLLCMSNLFLSTLTHSSRVCFCRRKLKRGAQTNPNISCSSIWSVVACIHAVSQGSCLGF